MTDWFFNTENFYLQKSIFLCDDKITLKNNNYFNFICVLSGSIELNYQNKKLVCKQGEIVYIPPKEITEIFAKENHTKAVLISLAFWQRKFEEKYNLQKTAVSYEILNAINNLPFEKQTVDCNFVWRTYQFLKLIQKYLQVAENKINVSVQNVIDYINENPTCKISELSNLCYLSQSRFYVVFKKYTNMTPTEMKRKIQLEKALELIKTTDFSIDEVSQRAGFSSVAYFRKKFKEKYFLTPSQMRKQK